MRSFSPTNWAFNSDNGFEVEAQIAPFGERCDNPAAFLECLVATPAGHGERLSFRRLT